MHKATFPCHKCNGKGSLSFCAHIDNGLRRRGQTVREGCCHIN
jgi:hypothetical protein